MKSKKERKEKRQSIFKEFIAFINKGNAIALAIGVILGGAFNAILLPSIRISFHQLLHYALAILT